MFKQAIVRTPCPEMVHGITTSNLGLPNYQLALEQHRLYIKTLASLGLDVKVLNIHIATLLQDSSKLLYQLIPTFPVGRSVWNNICIMELGNKTGINLQ